MATPAAPSAASSAGPGPIEQARRLAAEAEAREAGKDRAEYGAALRTFLSFAEANSKALEPAAAEVAAKLEETALAFYRLSETDLAARAVEAGLALAPGAASLMHRKALILLAQNRDVEEALGLVERALEASPNDKGAWATKGDALRLLGRQPEAAEAYLRAQRLDATSMQYVERALRVDPKNSTALRMKLELARAHGGDQPALDACEALLVTHPDDPALLAARADLLSSLGRSADALAAFGKALDVRPDDRALRFRSGREAFRAGELASATDAFTRVIEGDPPADPVTLAELAELAEAHAAELGPLALKARERLQAIEPKNLANLQALRSLAVGLGQNELAAATCRAILDASPDNLEAMRTVAELALSGGRVDEGLDAYRALLKAHPHETVDHQRALAAATTAGRPEAIVEFARGLLAESPSDRGGLEALATAYAARGDWTQALTGIDGLLSQRPQDVALLLEKKRLLTESGGTDALGPVLDELFRLDPTRYDIALERGHHYLALAYDHPEGSAERAQAAREALVSYERSSVDASLGPKSLLGIARAARLVGDTATAVTSYERFLAASGTGRRPDVLKELGHALRECGRYTDAERRYAEAIDLGLEDVDLYWGESEVLTELHQGPKALRYVDLLLQHEPENPLFLKRRGELLLRAGQRAEALETLRRAVAGARGDPKAHVAVAEALRSAGLYAEAAQYYRQAIDLDPKDRPARLALAETLERAGRPNEALPLLDALLHEEPNDLGAWTARANATRSLGRTTDLLYSLTAILLLEPHNPAALQEKARLHLDAGAKPEAYEALARLVDETGGELKDATVHLQLGDLATELGRVEEANRAYEQAAKLDPAQLPEIGARRARLRLAAGRPDLALEVLDETIGHLPADRPKSASALLLRAEILTALERPVEAQQVLEEVRKLEPGSPVATAGIARSLLDQGKHAEAKAFLSDALPRIPPQAPLYLLLAEANAGLGSLDDAVVTVQRGLEILPKATALWIRLGELAIARDAWADAAVAYAHALALDAGNAELHLKAGFVAEKMGHPNEALALYDRATQIAPTAKQAWVSRGLALLATGRPDDAQASFDRALSIDSDFDAAKEGKRIALQRTRESQIERFGREALLLEARLNRPVAKNDLFVTLHVPYDLLEPVLSALGRDAGVRLDRLTEAEIRDLEAQSYQLITSALERRPDGLERRGLSLADVAVLSPPTATLGQIQRGFAYLKAVLEADLRPENLRLTPDVEELARRGLELPESERTVFQLVRRLKVGLFRARIIKVVETAGTAVHAPLPTLDLGGLGGDAAAGAVPAGAPEAFFSPENVPAPPVAAAPPAHASGGRGADGRPVRCVGCGGLATIVHDCGAPICPHCVAEFKTCPKCGHPVDGRSSRPIAGSAGHPRGAASRAAEPAKPAAAHAAPARKPAAPPRPAVKPPPADRPKEAPPAASPAAAEPPPPPRPKRERADDEPRL